MKKRKIGKKSEAIVADYDLNETASMVDPKQPLTFQDLGLKLPVTPPTQVVSIRLPSELLNELRAIGSAQDVPYQALIKLLLAQGVSEIKKKVA